MFYKRAAIFVVATSFVTSCFAVAIDGQGWSLDNEDDVTDVERRLLTDDTVFNSLTVELVKQGLGSSDCPYDPNTEASNYGTAQMNGKIYMLCSAADSSKSVLVFNSQTFTLEERIQLSLDKAVNVLDVVACQSSNSLFFEGNKRTFYPNATVWKLDLSSRQVTVFADVIGYTSSMRITADCRLVILTATRDSDALYVFNAEGRLTSTPTIPWNPPVRSYRALLLDSGNFIVSHVNYQTNSADISLITSSGSVIRSYYRDGEASNGLVQKPWGLELINSDYFLEADARGAWRGGGTVNIIKTDLTRSRNVLMGEKDGLNEPYSFSYSPQTGLLVVKMLTNKSCNVYRINHY